MTIQKGNNMNSRNITRYSHIILTILLIPVVLYTGMAVGLQYAFLLTLILVCPIMMMFMMGGKGHKH